MNRFIEHVKWNKFASTLLKKHLQAFNLNSFNNFVHILIESLKIYCSYYKLYYFQRKKLFMFIQIHLNEKCFIQTTYKFASTIFFFTKFDTYKFFLFPCCACAKFIELIYTTLVLTLNLVSMFVSRNLQKYINGYRNF